MDRYLLALWIALFIAHQVDEAVKRFQARKRRKIIARRLKALMEETA